MGALQPMHLLVILVIVLIVFGAGRLPETFASLGKGVREFRANAESQPGRAGSKCAKCGAELASDAKFCPKCGAAVTA